MRLWIADCRLPTADCRLARYSTGAVATAFNYRKPQPSTIKSNNFSTRVSSVPTILKAVATAPVPYRDAIGKWQLAIANLQCFVLGLVQKQKSRKTFEKTVPKAKTLC